MKNFLLLTLCCCFLLLGHSCEKSPNPIPDPPYNPVDDLPAPYDTPNRSVLGCLIDGEPWGPSWGFNNLTYSYHNPSGGFNITAINLSSNIYSHVSISCRFSSIGDDFEISNPFPHANEKLCPNNNWEYSIDTTSYSNVSIDSFSTDDGVVIGTFEFTAINNECSDTVKITDGRFKATL